MNPLIEQLQKHMGFDLEAAIMDKAPEIEAAIIKMRSEKGDDDESPLVFSCSLSGKLNLDKHVIETAFSYSVKTAVKEKHPIEDPAQIRLPMSETDAAMAKANRLR